MTTSTESGANVTAELARRHKTTTTTVWSLLIAVVLLCGLAFVSKKFLTQQINSSLDIAVRITILIFGLGAITLRRTKFAAMRLQDIGALRGPSGLLITLQRTTVQVAIIGAAIGAIGFAATLLTGGVNYTYVAAVVGVVVILYAYPVRRSWERAVQRFAPFPNPANPSENPR